MIENYFSNQSIIKIISDIERKYPVETWMINGVHIWPIIRNGLPTYYIKKNTESNS